MKSKGLDTTVDVMLRRAKLNLDGRQAPGLAKLRLPQIGGGTTSKPAITFRPQTPKAPKVPEVKAVKYPFLRKR